jgi:hypothetical protein
MRSGSRVLDLQLKLERGCRVEEGSTMSQEMVAPGGEADFGFIMCGSGEAGFGFIILLESS